VVSVRVELDRDDDDEDVDRAMDHVRYAGCVFLSEPAHAGSARWKHDPEKWEPVFPRDQREAFARRSYCKQREREIMIRFIQSDHDLAGRFILHGRGGIPARGLISAEAISRTTSAALVRLAGSS